MYVNWVIFYIKLFQNNQCASVINKKGLFNDTR